MMAEGALTETLDKVFDELITVDVSTKARGPSKWIFKVRGLAVQRQCSTSSRGITMAIANSTPNNANKA